MVGRREGFCLQNKNDIIVYHHTCKNGRPRKINMYMVKQNVRSKANILEELKNVYRLFPFSCSTPTAAVEQVQWVVVRCRKFFFDDLFRFLLFSAHTLIWPTLWTSTSLSPIFFTQWVMWMVSVTWFNTIAQNPFKLDFNPKLLVCKYPKPYFRVIPLFPWIMNVYNNWLVVWNRFFFLHILGIVIPTDVYIFQRGWNHQPLIPFTPW